MSHNPSCRSLIFENPVVATLSCSPIQTARLFFGPECPGPTCAGFSCRTSHILSFLSLDVVTKRAPLALQERDWTMSSCLRVKRADPASMSHTFMEKSPEDVARMFSAEGLKSTCPSFLCTNLAVYAPKSGSHIYLECPVSLATGAISCTSSASVCRVNPSGTLHMNA